MRRGLLLGLCIAAAWAIVAPAHAGPKDPFAAAYEGRVERDRTTWLGFDVIRDDGRRKVARVAAYVPYNCDDGAAAHGYGRVNGRLTVGPGGRFAGTLEGDGVIARGADDRLTYALRGRLGAGGRARGTIDAVVRFRSKARGGGFTRCYTGVLDWRARRGADTDPLSRQAGRAR